jgi:hypothetical protein
MHTHIHKHQNKSMTLDTIKKEIKCLNLVMTSHTNGDKTEDYSQGITLIHYTTCLWKLT